MIPKLDMASIRTLPSPAAPYNLVIRILYMSDNFCIEWNAYISYTELGRCHSL